MSKEQVTNANGFKIPEGVKPNEKGSYLELLTILPKEAGQPGGYRRWCTILCKLCNEQYKLKKQYMLDNKACPRYRDGLRAYLKSNEKRHPTM